MYSLLCNTKETWCEQWEWMGTGAVVLLQWLKTLSCSKSYHRTPQNVWALRCTVWQPEAVMCWFLGIDSPSRHWLSSCTDFFGWTSPLILKSKLPEPRLLFFPVYMNVWGQRVLVLYYFMIRACIFLPTSTFVAQFSVDRSSVVLYTGSLW